MFKKSMSLILTGAMLTLVFAGINNGGASEKAGKIIPDITKTESSEQVTLTIWDTFVDGSLGQAQEDIITAYQEAHPNVTVERVAKDLSTLSETLKAAFMSGDAPDLVYYEAGIVTVGNYVKAGCYEDLASVYDEYGWKDNIMSACWEIPSADGYVWGDRKSVV